MVYSIIYLRRVSHKWKREQREASILTITYKILQLLTYKQIDKLFSDVQKYHCYNKSLQLLAEQKIGHYLVYHYSFFFTF